MISEERLTVEEYIYLTEAVGNKLPAKRLILKGLENGFTAKYIEDNICVGMARLITDSGYVGLIVDVAVMPLYQNRGIGTKLVQNLLEQVNRTLEPGEKMMIQLLATKGHIPFYEKLGFKNKKEVIDAGMYMWYTKN